MSRREEGLFVAGFLLSGEELPGWRSAKATRLEAFGRPMTQSFLVRLDAERGADGVDGALVEVAAYEADAEDDAPALFEQVLSEFQGPVAQARDSQREAVVGDDSLAFGDTAVVVRRANVVYIVRNAGREVVPVIEAAQSVDRLLSERPDGDRGKGEGRVQADLSDDEVRVQGQGGETWLKYFTPGGRLRRTEGGRLRPEGGPSEVLVVVMGPRGVEDWTTVGLGESA